LANHAQQLVLPPALSQNLSSSSDPDRTIFRQVPEQLTGPRGTEAKRFTKASVTSAKCAVGIVDYGEQAISRGSSGAMRSLVAHGLFTQGESCSASKLHAVRTSCHPGCAAQAVRAEGLIVPFLSWAPSVFL
jgi:hypothetical protein